MGAWAGDPRGGGGPLLGHYADLFVGSIGATDLLREGFAERSLARAPLSAPSAVELARRMGPGADRMALILDVERTDRLLPRLTEEGWPYEVAERPSPEATGEETS